MKKNKTHFLLAISATMLVPVLAGCGGGNDKIVLKIGFWPESSETKDVAMYQEWADKFMEDNPEYEVRGTPYTYSKETVGEKFTSGLLPDVWQTWFTEPEMLKNKNIIRPITKALKDRGWDEKMDDEMKDTLTFGDDIYGIPRDGYGLGLLINKRILGENDLIPTIDGKYSIFNEDGTPAYPTTWEEVKEMAVAIGEYEDATRGFMMYSANKNGGWVFSNMAWNYGARLQIDEGNGHIKANLNCKEAVAALQCIADMKLNDGMPDSISVVYTDWSSSIGDRVAMAVVGSDVLQNAKLLGGVEMSDLAFVPVPTGDGVHQFSLYGGTPFVFTKGLSDAKVEGILKFFDYIGRSPETSKTNFDAKKQGYETAKIKGQPILPDIMPWKDPEYVSQANALMDEYINVDMKDYDPFFSKIQSNKHPEEPYLAQEMYEKLDLAIQRVLRDPNTDCYSALSTANADFQKLLDAQVNH